MKIGFARISTKHQTLQGQIDSLKKEGCEEIYAEQVSGAAKINKRPELENMLRALRKGDIVICGEHETVFSDLIGDPVNHAVIYVGRRRFVEAIGKGVVYVSFHKLFTEYHNYVILRTIKGTKRKIKMAAVKWAKSQIGQAYDYDFSSKNNSYFCSELVNEAYTFNGLFKA